MRAFILLALLASASAVAQAQYVRPTNSDCVSAPSGDVSLFPKEYMVAGDVTQQPFFTEVNNAQGFTVEYYSSYKVVKNNIADETYVLYQCGTPPPATDAVPAGSKFFEIPLTSLSAPETVPYAFVEILGLDDRVNDVSKFVTSSCGQKILTCGNEGSDAVSVVVESHGALNNDTLLSATVSPFVDGLLTTAGYSYPKSFAFSAAQDPGVLNRAEWIKFLGLFFNKDKYASDVFEGIQKQYTSAKEAALKASEGGNVPVVAWASHYLYDTDESYQLSFAPYKAELVADAGAKMMDFDALSKIPGVRPSAFSNTTLEFAWAGEGAFATKAEAQAAFLKALQSVDIVIDETFTMDPATYNLAAFQTEYGIEGAAAEGLSWLSSNLIYREDGLLSKNGGLDWFEGAIARPEKVLADVVRMVEDSRGAKDTANKFNWLRRIDETPQVVGPDACTRITSCTEEPTPICPFVAVCGDGSTVLLKSEISTNGQCAYESCPLANTAQMAAPAIIMLTILIVFVEALINFC